MSGELELAVAALDYQAAPELPVGVLAVGYGEALAVPDTVDTVEVTWRHLYRPAVLTTTQTLVGDWQGAMDALIRLRVYDVERVFAALGGWPDATPLPTDFEQPAGELFGVE